MKYLSRPYRSSLWSLGVAAFLGAGIAVAPPGASAQVSSRIEQIVKEPSLLLHSGSQGYLGVLVGDVDAESAPRLKLKEARGVVVTLIDHDAPAAQAGIRVNDAVLQLNGKAVNNSDQFSRMMREIPAGHTVSLLISRDGIQQTIGVQLADRKKMEHDVWNKIDGGGEEFTSVPSMGLLSSGGDAPLPGGFHMPFFGSSLNVGAMVEPLTSQMADYLGVSSGLMVKQVARKSAADAAGFRAFDVILKVGAETVNTLADWDRALRSNQGKPVQVTILRNKKQETLTLYVDSKHHHAELEDLLPDGDCPTLAALLPEFAQDLAQQSAGLADQMVQQSEGLRQSLQDQNFQIDQKQLEQMQQQIQQQMQRQMDEFRRNFKPEDLKPNSKQMEEFRRKMEQFRQQMQQLQTPRSGRPV
ncbi:MAG: PDZ domain-containing protein [Acidobacteriota bacterium]|nr:PDZ domain-containing protein [Acidobacteriota bacterium]